MIFNKKKPPPQEQQTDKVATPTQNAEKFIKQARSFEQTRFANNEKKAKFFMFSFFGALVVIAFQAVAIMSLGNLKEVVHWMTLVDTTTGYTSPISVLKESITTHGEVTDKYWLARYVGFRESYDWETIQATYDATNLLSAPDVQAEFKRFYDDEKSPVKVLQNRAVVRVKIISISFLGDIAQVRFEQTILPTASGNKDMRPITTRSIATIAYNYSNLPTKEEDRLVNPIGYQTVSYRVDPESFN